MIVSGRYKRVERLIWQPPPLESLGCGVRVMKILDHLSTRYQYLTDFCVCLKASCEVAQCLLLLSLFRQVC